MELKKDYEMGILSYTSKSRGDL